MYIENDFFNLSEKIVNISILAKTLNFLILIALGAGAAIAEITSVDQNEQKQISQSQDQNGEELSDDDMMIGED